MLEYYNFVEEPSLQSFRINDSRQGLPLNMITWWFVVTGESGARYNLIRTLGMPRKSQVLNFGLLRGSDNVDTKSELVIPFSEVPTAEAYWVEESDDAVIYGGETFRIEMRLDGFEVEDANGRIKLSARRHGKSGTFFIPPQPLLEHGLADVSSFCSVTGTIDGEAVEGTFMDDHIYSRPDLDLAGTGLISKLENYWIQWLVEYEDGTVEGGSAWRGMPGTGFAHAHHVVDGVSHARGDAKLDIVRNANTSMESVTLTLGTDVTIEFTQLGAFDTPFHTFGKATSSTRTKKIVKSWNYLENWPTNFGLFQEYQAAYAKLYRRFPSMGGLLEGARVENESIVLDNKS